MTIQRITCFVDLSPSSVVGARFARAIAARHGAVLELVHATKRPILSTTIGDELTLAPPIVATAIERRHTRALRAKLDELVADISYGGEVAIHAHLLHETSVSHLLLRADEAKANLIVIATAEPGFFQRILHRSVPEKLARRAHGPVLVVAAETDVRPPLRHVLVATDYSDASRVAIQLASDIVGPDGGLSFVHVWQEPTPTELGEQRVDDVDSSDSGGSKLPADDVGRLRNFIAELPLRQMAVDAFVDFGDPARAIARRAAELDVDAIVVGSHPHEDWGERLFGTVADRLIESADRPVLAVPVVSAAESVQAPQPTRVDRTLAESFPASDPPSWWASGGRS